MWAYIDIVLLLISSNDNINPRKGALLLSNLDKTSLQLEYYGV